MPYTLLVSTLLLVRHGQASLHADDYDVLSEKGRAQSRALGMAWATRRLPLDALYVGPRRRHRDTAEEMRLAAEEIGRRMPDPQQLDAFDEMEVPAITEEAMRRVLPSCPDLREQLRSGKPDDNARTALRHLGGVMRHLMQRWVEKDPMFAEMEPFAVFSERVQEGLWRIMREQGRGKTVAVVTSGGPISVAMQAALDLTLAKTLDMMFVLGNGSVSALRYTENQLTADSFNITTHISPALVSYV